MKAQEAENAPDLADKGGKTACGRVGQSRGCCCEALQATWGADSEAAAHQEADVEGRGMIPAVRDFSREPSGGLPVPS